MTNTINNISDVGKVIAKMGAAMLADNAPFYQSCDKEPASSFGQVNGYNVGQTINISKPARPVIGTTADITSGLNDVIEEKVAMTLNQRFVANCALTSLEIQNSLALKDWGNRVLKQYMSGMGQTIDAQYMTLAKNATYNLVGTAGSTVYNTATMASARERLKKGLAPLGDDLTLALESTAMSSAYDSRKGLFQDSSQIAKQYRSGVVGIADGFQYVETNLLPTHTRGTQTGSFTVATTSTTGDSTIALTGTSGGTLKAGDVFTVASVFAVHPITKVTQNYLQQFVVTADNTAVSTAYTGVAVSPSIYFSTSGSLQNVNRLPTSGDVVTIVGVASTGYQQQLAFHKQAFRVASVPLMKPEGAHMVGQETVDGMTVRVWMDSIILTDKMILRLDFLGAFCPVRPEWACRITS